MGVQLLLKGIKHALDVRFNLISVQLLDDCGYDNHFGSSKWKLTKDNLVMARGRNNLNCTGLKLWLLKTV